jgi:hypothetical protein
MNKFNQFLNDFASDSDCEPEHSSANTQKFLIKYKYKDISKYPEIFSMYKQKVEGNEHSILFVKTMKLAMYIKYLLSQTDVIELDCLWNETNSYWEPSIPGM